METHSPTRPGHRFWHQPEVERVRTHIDAWAAAKRRKLAGVETDQTTTASPENDAEKLVDQFLNQIQRPLLAVGLLYRLYPRDHADQRDRGGVKFRPTQLFGGLCSAEVERARAALGRAIHRELVERLIPFTQKCSDKSPSKSL